MDSTVWKLKNYFRHSSRVRARNTKFLARKKAKEIDVVYLIFHYDTVYKSIK